MTLHIIFLKAACGLTYLTVEKRMIHGDIAARNCISIDHLINLSINNSGLLTGAGVLKISDFGMLLELPANVDELIQLALSIDALPVGWLAPESLRTQPTKSFKTDAYAYGVLVWEVRFTGSLYVLSLNGVL